MATWKSENSLLTAVGEEIFNKIKVGNGSVHITRIVAGSGRVAPSQLLKQVTISGTQKNLSVTNIVTETEGSEISFNISNDDFTEPYVINQIGVFVTHPDYTGEQLYHISQCEEGEADTIPAYVDNPVTIGYTLFLVHSNNGSVTISLDPSGMVRVGDFESFKTEVNYKHTELDGSIASLEKSLEDTNKDLSDLGTSLRNSLTETSTTLGNNITNLGNSFNTFKSGAKAGKLLTVDSNGNLIASGKNTVSGQTLTVTDAIAHRALSLSIGGLSTQTPEPTVSAPVNLVNSKVSYVRVSDGSNPKLINLPSAIELRSLGDYKDTIEWDGAKWWKVQRIQEVVLDGTTNGVYYDGNSSKTYCRYAITSGTLYKQIKDHIPTAPIKTSHGNTVGETSELYAFHYSSNGGIVGHFLNTVTGVDPDVQTTMQTKCAKINEWLKAQKDVGTPVKVWYVLKTPVVTEISLTTVLEMYTNRTEITCPVEGNAVSMTLGYAINTTDDTTMYILKSLARKSDVQVANTFAVAELLE